MPSTWRKSEYWKTMSVLQASTTRSACPQSTVSWISTSWGWSRYIVFHLSSTLTEWRNNNTNMCQWVPHSLTTLYKVSQCSFVWYGLSSLFSKGLNLMPVPFPMDISSLTRQGSTCGRPGREVHHFLLCHKQCSWAAWWKCHHVCCCWSVWGHTQPCTTQSLLHSPFVIIPWQNQEYRWAAHLCCLLGSLWSRTGSPNSPHSEALYLPPYSPFLNQIEVFLSVWQWTVCEHSGTTPGNGGDVITWTLKVSRT